MRCRAVVVILIDGSGWVRSENSKVGKASNQAGGPSIWRVGREGRSLVSNGGII